MTGKYSRAITFPAAALPWPKLAALAVMLLLAGNARANSAAPADFWIHQDGQGAVEICPSYPRPCPDQGLLRRDVASGAIVSITSCSASSPECFWDECVPAGTYEYGFAVPYACSKWGSYYFSEATVEGAPGGCTRSLPEPAPASSVPWPVFGGRGVDRICASTYDGPPFMGCSTGGGVLGLNVLAVAAGLLLRRRGRRR